MFRQATTKEGIMQATKHRTYTIEQIKLANRNANGHWFDPDTLRFFGSRVLATTYGPDSNGLIYFVSSERTGFDQDAPRAYSVRAFHPPTATIDTVGEFCGHATRSLAIGAAKRAAAA
jgi:hypothetical protein